MCAAVAAYYGLELAGLWCRGDAHIARAVAAWLCRCHTEEPLRVLATRLGLSRADSVPNLTRRVEARLRVSRELAGDLERMMRNCSPKTKNKV